MGEIGKKSFAMIGNIEALEEKTEKIPNAEREDYTQKINNIKTSMHSLNDLIKALDIQKNNVTILELKSILNKLYEIKLIAKSKTLNIKQNFDNEYEIIKCDAQTLIYIIVDIIEFLIEQKNEINILCKKENDNLIFEFCNEINDSDLINKVNKLAMEDNHIEIKMEYNQVTILVK